MSLINFDEIINGEKKMDSVFNPYMSDPYWLIYNSWFKSGGGKPNILFNLLIEKSIIKFIYMQKIQMKIYLKI